MLQIDLVKLADRELTTATLGMFIPEIRKAFGKDRKVCMIHAESDQEFSSPNITITTDDMLIYAGLAMDIKC